MQYTEEELKKMKNEAILHVQNKTVNKLEELKELVLKSLDEIEELEKTYENCLKVLQSRIG